MRRRVVALTCDCACRFVSIHPTFHFIPFLPLTKHPLSNTNYSVFSRGTRLDLARNAESERGRFRFACGADYHLINHHSSSARPSGRRRPTWASACPRVRAAGWGKKKAVWTRAPPGPYRGICGARVVIVGVSTIRFAAAANLRRAARVLHSANFGLVGLYHGGSPRGTDETVPAELCVPLSVSHTITGELP